MMLKIGAKISTFYFSTSIMNNPSLKTLIVTIFISFLSFTSKAQLGYNYSKLDFGIAGTVNTVYGDTQTQQIKESVDVSINYNQTPFVNYIFDFQGGNLSGGDVVKDADGRQFSNNYIAGIGRIQLQLGELIDYSKSPIANAFKNFYLSTGLGFMANNVSTLAYIPQQDLYVAGEDNNTEVFIPVRVGYEFKLFNDYDEPKVKFDIGYQYNYVFGDEVDGFKAGKSNDVFTQFSVGVKFALGSPTSYRKQISY